MCRTGRPVAVPPPAPWARDVCARPRAPAPPLRRITPHHDRRRPRAPARVARPALAHRDTSYRTQHTRQHRTHARHVPTKPHNTRTHALFRAHHASVVASVGQQHSSVRCQYGGLADDRSAPIPNIPPRPLPSSPPWVGLTHRPCTIATQLRSHATVSTAWDRRERSVVRPPSSPSTSRGGERRAYARHVTGRRTSTCSAAGPPEGGASPRGGGSLRAPR